MMDQLDRSWNARLKAEAAGRRVVLQRLIEGCKASDFESFVLALSEVDSLFIHRAAFLKLARMNPPSAKFCRFFRDRVWLRFGDHLRQEVGDDLLFCDVLRVLMPPYRGPALRLYRGETVWNRRQRTYGMSWTTSSEVADSFATGIMRTFEGGSVVIETLAPPGTIICRIPHSADRYGEREYLVDRRQLGEVRVVARYSQADV